MSKKISSKLVITLSVVAVILLLVANFAFWLEAQIFNQDNFAQATVKVIQREEVQNALAAEIVDNILKNQPEIPQAAAGLLESAVAGLIGSPIIEPVVEKAAVLINIALTSKRPEPIVINVAQIKEFLEPILSKGDLGAKLETAEIPDTIVLFGKNQIPSIYTLGVVFLWVGPIAGLIGLAIIIALIWMAKGDDRNYVLRAIGHALSIGALVVIILALIFKAPILASITGENLKIIASNIYSVFVGRFIFQNLYLIIIGLILIGFSYYIPYYKQRRAEAEK